MKKVYFVVAIALIGMIVVFSHGVRRAEAPQNDIMMEPNVMSELKLTSSAFSEGESIPALYTCDGDNISPPLQIDGVPDGTVSLALIMDDPDIPDVVKRSMLIDKFDHWILFNLPLSTTAIKENYDGEGVSGANSAKGVGYTGPCPPADLEPTEHRYVFQLYALDAELPLREGATESDVRNAMKGHILDKTEFIGVYSRAK